MNKRKMAKPSDPFKIPKIKGAISDKELKFLKNLISGLVIMNKS